MKPSYIYQALFLLLIFSLPLFPQINYSGSLRSSFYAFETLTDTSEIQQLDFYQALQLRVTPRNYSNLHVSTYLRVAKMGDEDWEERVYNLYADWKANNNRLNLRLGRQFMYQGVINGTLDGIQISGRPTQDLTLKFFGGLSAPPNRDFELLEWDEGNVLGLYGAYRLPYQAKLDVSYYQRNRNDETVWQLVGLGLSGKFRKDFYYQAQFDHNLLTEEFQGMRYRLNYFYQKWQLSAEYNSQKPRVLEDSYFTIFKLKAYNQFRGGVTYNLNRYQLGAQYIFTAMEFDETNQIVLTAGIPWGVIGFVFQDGFGGKNTGVYGELRYDILPRLTARGYSSFYSYERQTTVLSQDAVAFSGGLDFRPYDPVLLQADIQQSINSVFEDDIRGLFRLSYFFRN